MSELVRVPAALVEALREALLESGGPRVQTAARALVDAAERPDEDNHGGRGWEATETGWRCTECHHEVIGPVDVHIDAAHRCTPAAPMGEPLCKCGHTRDMHDICHFDHNQCLCGCNEFRYPPTPAAPVGEPLPLGHEYVGNLCSGFGGTTECEWFDIDTRQRCGQSPGAHRPNPFTPAPLSSPRRTRDEGTEDEADALRAERDAYRDQSDEDQKARGRLVMELDTLRELASAYLAAWGGGIPKLWHDAFTALGIEPMDDIQAAFDLAQSLAARLAGEDDER